jgi:hypothetical protein
VKEKLASTRTIANMAEAFLLEAAGSTAEPARMFKLYDPPEFEALKRTDAVLYRAGRPNLLDHPR